ncbi:unnamed protein product [Anisakis simplex]|uniref:Ankyrin repeat protein n=1 Tax=Anisakis simplex TaxID=6269 RepID=A0A0M3J8N7_ANISI|nr:unnamed protein product [Anisakis simplex]
MRIFEAFVKNLESTSVDERILRVFNELLASDINWYSRNAQGILTSESLEHLARHGPLEILNALKERLVEHPDPNSDDVQFSNGNENPLVGIVEYWIESGIPISSTYN